MTGEWRYDRSELVSANVRKGAGGCIILDATVAVSKVLRYPQPDGSIYREYVPPEVLEAANAQLERAPLTLRHPSPAVYPQGVTAANAERLVVGDSAKPRMEGKKSDVTLAIRRHDAISAVESGEREISAGYFATIDRTPGVSPDGEPYDAVQTARFYNHLAIVPRGRAGRECAMHLDSEDIEEEQPMDDVIAKIVELFAGLGTRLDSEDAKTKDLFAGLTQRLDAIEASLRPAEGRHDADEEAEKFYAERVRLDALAASFGIEKGAKGESNKDYAKRVCLAHNPELRLDDGEWVVASRMVTPKASEQAAFTPKPSEAKLVSPVRTFTT